PGRARPDDDAAARQALGAPRLRARLRVGRYRALLRGAPGCLQALQAARGHAQGGHAERRLRGGERLMSTRRYTVACLSGDGCGPEVMAEASLALQETARLHGFFLEEQHVPFGSEALLRFGHPLPL